MKEKDNDNIMNESKNNVKGKKKVSGIVILIIILIIGVILSTLLFTGQKGDVKTTVKSSLDRIVEKADLETVNVTYNIIAKKCKDKNNCNMKSNNVDDFEMVVSCKGTITAGFDFNKIKLSVDEKNKKIIVTIPDAIITDEPNIGTVKLLNEDKLPADILPEARKLCQETTKERAQKDAKLIPAAKDQARVVLEEYYNQWIKAKKLDYKVEIK